MKPIRVKLYGMFPFTKKLYLICQAIGFGVCSLLLLAALTLDLPQLLFPSGKIIPAARWLLENLAWLVVAVMVLELGETFFTWRKFAQKEALTRAAPAADQPPAPTR